MSHTAIILAGGKGTRLRSVVSDIPKPMAPIGQKPFLAFLLDFLKANDIQTVILGVGYKAEVIKKYFGATYHGMDLLYSYEDSPLGTGGAIAKAMRLVQEDQVFVLNGDSFIDISLRRLRQKAKETKSAFLMTIKEMQDFDRYGTVELDGDRVTQFNEKQPVKAGFINAGVYLMQKDLLAEFPEKFSFEQEFMEKKVSQMPFYSLATDGYFIDIGIPSDYALAQKKLNTVILQAVLNNIDASWTLFLDRDGVINRRIVDGYVTKVDDFEFFPKVQETIVACSKRFGQVIVITNQQGVAKGIMSHQEVEKVHSFLRKQIENKGGKISQIYFCPEWAHKTDNCRKPNPHMAQWAKKEFPDIDFSKSIMVGDMGSDIQFGHQLGMMTVWIQEHPKIQYTNPSTPDFIIPHLYKLLQ